MVVNSVVDTLANAITDTLIDSHCHLNYDYAPKTVDDLVREAQAAGVSHMMTIGTEMETLADIVRISEAHDCVFHTVGVHPHDAAKMKDEDLALLEKAATHPKCRAIGEIGLDYHYNHSPKETQIQRLNEQLEIALKLSQPIVIHSRDGEEDLLKSLKPYAAKVKDRPPGVIHCFTGTAPFAQACVAMGFYISFSGILTFKKAEDLREIAKALPLDRILVETDSPYLAPIPMRGRKCEPSMVRLTAQKLAEVHGVSFSEVAAQTTKNSKNLFRLT